jgi:hypothetical protein
VGAEPVRSVVFGCANLAVRAGNVSPARITRDFKTRPRVAPGGPGRVAGAEAIRSRDRARAALGSGRRIDGRSVPAEVLEDPFNNRRFLDAGDDPQTPATTAADLDVDRKDALEASRPGEGSLPVRGRCLAGLRGLPGSGRARLRHDPRPIRARRREDPVIAGQVGTGFGTSAASRAMKSSGSKITCVVPSRYGVFSAKRTSPFSVSDSRSVAIGGLAPGARGIDRYCDVVTCTNRVWPPTHLPHECDRKCLDSPGARFIAFP